MELILALVSFSGVSKLMSKEIIGSKRPPETEGGSFCGLGCFALGVWKQSTQPIRILHLCVVCLFAHTEL